MFDVTKQFETNAQARNFFFFSFLALLLAYPVTIFMVVGAMKAPVQYIVVDPNKTAYKERGQSFEELRGLHQHMLSLATHAMMDRSSNGLDNTEVAKMIFVKDEYDKLTKLVKSETHFQTQNIHQKVEIDKIVVLKIEAGVGQASVVGQLIQNGSTEAGIFTRALKFRLLYQFKANTDFNTNGLFPVVISDSRVTIETP